jgi:hypothetical protein
MGEVADLVRGVLAGSRGERSGDVVETVDEVIAGTRIELPGRLASVDKQRGGLGVVM